MKDKLYKTLLQSTVNTDLFIALKTEFKFYQKILRRSIREAKFLYYTKTFALHFGMRSQERDGLLLVSIHTQV